MVALGRTSKNFILSLRRDHSQAFAYWHESDHVRNFQTGALTVKSRLLVHHDDAMIQIITHELRDQLVDFLRKPNDAYVRTQETKALANMNRAIAKDRWTSTRNVDDMLMSNVGINADDRLSSTVATARGHPQELKIKLTAAFPRAVS